MNNSSIPKFQRDYYYETIMRAENWTVNNEDVDQLSYTYAELPLAEGKEADLFRNGLTPSDLATSEKSLSEVLPFASLFIL
ncbi:MAG: hypothetical protein R3C11_28135 [Planctomycetaceae bacterium]